MRTDGIVHGRQAGGLTGAEAKRRLEAQGPNILEKKKKINPLAIFLSQFTDFLTIILLMSTGLSFLLGEKTEAITIIAIVLVNAFLGFFQEYKTEKTIDALKNMAAPHSRVLRDGKVITIPSSEIVVDDVMFIEAGDKVPSDAGLLKAFDLHVDESLLTGESVPVEKSAHGRDNAGKLFMGTVVTRGHAQAVTTATGMRTEMGKIAGLLDEIEEPPTPLQIRLDQLGKWIAIACLAICAVVSITGILRGENVLDMIVMGISLSVAAVPEGLSAIVTISLALAVGRMVKRNALIRKLHAVETLGCSSVICSDKTGTLTENKMTVRKIFTYDHEYTVTGDGYETEGKFLKNMREAAPLSDEGLKMALVCACVCNNAELALEGAASVSANGDPTEIALLVACRKANLKQEDILRAYPKVNELPFDSDRKCMSVFAGARGAQKIFTKGAPDMLLDKCTRIYLARGAVPLTDAMRGAILQCNERMGAESLRVIGVAYKENVTAAGPSAETGLTFLGLFGMIDPLRKASYEAVRVCREAGIRPVMITGDHMVTAKAIAKELRIYQDGDRVLTGKDLDGMSEEALRKAVCDTSVYARVSPRHKLQIVRALRQNGHVAAMTGDGVNDAPAIKEADIGVAMGVSGTDVAKEAADVILLDDNFATLVAAVEEGRVIYKNIRKFIRYLLSCNVGEVLTMFIGMLMGLPVVLLPIQILWVNLVTDGLPAIALGMEPPDGDEMHDPPRNASDSVFSGGLARKIFIRGALIAVCTLSVFMVLSRRTGSLDTARTGAFLTLVLTQLIHVFECKSEKKSLFQMRLGNNKWLLMAAAVSLLMMVAVIYLPFLQGVFHTVPLDLSHLLYIVLITLVVPVLSGFMIREKAKGEPAPLNRKC